MKNSIILKIIEKKIKSLLNLKNKLEDKNNKELFDKLQKLMSKNPKPEMVMQMLSFHLKKIFTPEAIKDLEKQIFPYLYVDKIKIAKDKMIKAGKIEAGIKTRFREVDRRFYFICCKYLTNEKGKIDVNLLSKIFGIDITPQPEVVFNDIVTKAVIKMELLNPLLINHPWLKKNTAKHSILFSYIKKHHDGNWRVFIQAIPKKWQHCCNFKRAKQYNLLRVLKELRISLEKNNPDFFNSGYIQKYAPNAYSHIFRMHRDFVTEKPNHDLVVRHLSVKWQHRWDGKRRTPIPLRDAFYIFETAIEALKLILKKNNPNEFTLQDIKVKWKNRKLYSYFRKRVRNRDNYIDIPLIRSCLSAKYRKCFKNSKTKNAFYYSLPTDPYENLIEVQRVIDKEKLKLYVFFCNPTKDNRELCDKACREIIKLAQKGNISAYNLLFNYLEEVTASWIINNRDLFVLSYLREDVNLIIKKFIYMYEFKYMFLSYLFKIMKFKASEFRILKTAELRLDQRGFFDATNSNHELIGNDHVSW